MSNIARKVLYIYCEFYVESNFRIQVFKVKIMWFRWGILVLSVCGKIRFGFDISCKQFS